MQPASREGRPEPAASQACAARLLRVSGQIQGVGFRPFVSRLAQALRLAGWVRNLGGEVEIWIEGPPPVLESFQTELRIKAPPLARIDGISAEPRALSRAPDFAILKSDSGDPRQAHVPPDYFICDDCLAELRDPRQRRYRYPFTNCTQCGPRYTLIDRLPYDRVNTSMATFELCPDCRAEYENPTDRRYHAQPLACPACGPSLRLVRADTPELTDTEAALAESVDLIRRGQILALKGVGGYHLICDARDSQAVQRLRSRKHRPDKPFALMFPWTGQDGLNTVRECVRTDPAAEAFLASPLRPIVLLKLLDNAPIAGSVAPGLEELGVMLPYSPLHHLLLESLAAPVLATSANLSGEPVLTWPEEVEARLRDIADAFLHHDRPIRRPADDPVFRIIAGKPRPIRLGRGCAPREVDLPFELPYPIVAVGGQMKNTIAIAWERRAVISPHIGDLGSRRSLEVFEQVITDLSTLYGLKIHSVVCDAHPDYRSSRWARASGLSVQAVFHHHAHASALAGEHGLAKPMLVFTWDGTGYGKDGSLWGGEALLGSPGRWERVGSFRPFRLPGGEKVAHQPWRSAAGLCWEAGLDPDLPRDEAHLLKQAWQKGLNSPWSSAVGRLFDAAAALTGLLSEASYDGQGPMLLEAVSSDRSPATELPLVPDEDGLLRTDWKPLLALLMDEGISPRERGGRFHASLALALVRQAERVRERHGIETVGLSGGVFQNRLLTELVLRELARADFKTYLHERIPANDAGLSYGQIIEAAARLNA